MSAEQVTRAVEQSQLLESGSRVVVLLSGGQDSVCLLDIAVKLLGKDAVIALHLDYGLREESGRDANYCRKLCRELGVALEVISAHYSGSGNVQAWARESRYREAERLATSFGAAVAVAHTATDRIETVLYRLLTSPGRRALTAMRPLEGRVVRPLLQIEREQTLAYCQVHGLDFVIDASNDSPKYIRNRIRNELLPLLTSLDPMALKNAQRTVDEVALEGEYIETVAATLLGDSETIELDWLRAQDPVLQGLIARQLAERSTGRLVPDARTRVDELLELASLSGSKQVDLAGVTAIIEYGTVRFELPGHSVAPEPISLAIPGRTQFGRYELSCEPYRGEPSEGVVDLEKLGEAVTVRPWRHGDRLRPVGLGGTKSVQDLFTDRKIPRATRESYPLVESGGEIVWIPGIATAENFGVTANTEVTVIFAATTV